MSERGEGKGFVTAAGSHARSCSESVSALVSMADSNGQVGELGALDGGVTLPGDMTTI